MNLPARRRSGPFRSTVSVVLIPHTPGSSRQAFVFHQRSWFRYIPGASKSTPVFAQPPGQSDPRGRPPAQASDRTRPSATRSHVPRSQRLSRRHFAPSTWKDCWSLALSLSLTASHPRVGMGNAFRGLGCAGPGEPANKPHSGTRDSLTTHGSYAASACGASASGAAPSAPSASAGRVSVPPDFSGPVPSVHSPLHPSDSGLCSALPACHFD